MLTLSVNGTFTFVSHQQSGSSFDVVVQRHPLGATQHCTVTNGAGTVAAANVANIQVECAAIYPRFAYGANQSDTDSPNAISVYRMDPVTGQLGLNGYAVVNPQGPQYFALHPSGRHAYLSSYIGHLQAFVTPYSIDAISGELTAGAPETHTTRGIGLVFEPRGRFLYTWIENSIFATRVDPSTGERLGGGGGLSFPDGTFPAQPAFDPAGHFAYMLIGHADGSHVLQEFAIDQATGGLTMIGQVPVASGYPVVPTVDSARHLYVPSAPDHDSIRGFQINGTTGQLTEIPGSPFLVNHGGRVLIEPANRFAYVANGSSGNIDIYAIDAATGALSPAGSAPATGATLTVSSVDPTGRFLYATEQGRIFTFLIDRTSGALSDASRVRSRGLVGPLQFIAGGTAAGVSTRYAYVTNDNDATVSGYSVDAAGTLTPVSGSPFAVPAGVRRMLVDSRSRFALVTGNTELSSFELNASTGALNAAPGSPFPAGANPAPLSMNARGKYLYVGDGANIIGFNFSSGALTPIVPPSWMPPQPWPLPPPSGDARDVVVDPFGETLFVLDPSNRTLYRGGIQDGASILRSQEDTGALRFSGADAVTGADPRALTIGPTGEFLYTANFGSNDVSVLDMALKPVPGSPFAAGAGPRDVAVDPSGRFAYVANCLDNSLSAYRVDGRTGALSPISGSPFPAGSCPESIEVDAAGGFLLVLDNASTISTYGIDPLTGALLPRSAIATGGGGASAIVLVPQRH
jgi:6-phosphogluconolactonase (cycloisomerase 2 family)